MGTLYYLLNDFVSFISFRWSPFHDIIQFYVECAVYLYTLVDD